MAFIPLYYVYPNVYAAYIEPQIIYSVERDPIFLLIEEVINYSLHYHNLHSWIPPVNLDFVRSMTAFTYFNETFAATVVSPDTEEQAMRLANTFGFDEDTWLEFTDLEEARLYQEYYLVNIFHQNEPFLYQMFSFGCYSSRIALQMNRHSLANTVVWALLAALRNILPSEEYHREFHFVDNEHINHPDDNQPHDVDEGIVDEDNGSTGIDLIFLFVEELIEYSLRFNNLHNWIPALDIQILRRNEMSYFTENLGRAVNLEEEDALRAARAWGFNEDTWLGLSCPCEAQNFQIFYLYRVLHFYGGPNEIRMFSFACYSSQVALRANRNSLVNQVVSALAHLLRQFYPLYQNYGEFDELASECNRFHLDVQSRSEDDGVGEVGSNNSDEIYDADISEEDFA